jgi:uncharacterized membrane protein required for colicin V production
MGLQCSYNIEVIQTMSNYFTDYMIGTLLHFMDSIIAVNECMPVLTAVLFTVLKMYKIAFSDFTLRNTEYESYACGASSLQGR